jgi:hypothetical protein
MVSSLVPGALIASVRPALPLPDDAAEALWSVAAPLHRGEPRRFLDLAKDERHWRLLAALHSIDPALAALGFATGKFLASAKTERPVRALRQALSKLGVSRVVWRDLVQYRLPDARQLFESSGSESVISHLRLASLHGEPLPFDGPVADWAAQFRLSTICGPTWHLTVARWELSPALAVRVLREGLRRLAAGSFTTFVDEELPVVAAWRTHLGKGAARANWSTLLTRARAAEAAEERALTAQGQRWETGMTTREFAGVQITTLPDGVALWREGLQMHHCVGDYAERCLSGMNRVFHLDTGDGSRGWTLALRADGEGGWKLDDLRGLRNALPPAPLRFLGKEWAGAYGEVFESDPTVLDDERPEICSVCREEWCNAHLVLSTDIDEGILGGVFYEEDKALDADLQSAIADLLLSGKAPPTHWPSEWTSVHEELAKIPKDELFDLINDEDDGPRWEAGDAFHDIWSECNGRRTIVSWIEEWVMEQSGTHSKYTEISTAPGLSWAGWSVYAENPQSILEAFKAEVRRLFQPAVVEVAP